MKCYISKSLHYKSAYHMIFFIKESKYRNSRFIVILAAMLESNITNVSFTKFDIYVFITIYRNASPKSITGDVCSI